VPYQFLSIVYRQTRVKVNKAASLSMLPDEISGTHA
jgi:hypothetical protein